MATEMKCTAWLLPDKTTPRASSEVIFMMTTKKRLFVGRERRYVKRIRHFYVEIDTNSCSSYVLWLYLYMPWQNGGTSVTCV